MHWQHTKSSCWLHCFLIGSLSRSLLGLTEHANNHTLRDFGSPTTVIEAPLDVYEYVSAPLNWWQADKYCEQRFAELLLESSESELSKLQELLRSQRLTLPVWLSDRGTPLKRQVAKRRRIHPLQVLEFRTKTDTKFAKVLAEFPLLPAISACAYVQWDNKSKEIATIFSYAVPKLINEFQLRGYTDEEGLVRFALIVHGYHSPYFPVFRSDGMWHHFCVTWQKWNSSWEIYTDGKKKSSAKGLAAFQDIDEQGTFIIGQDQDSLGGSFKEKDSFSGNITDLNVWRKVLTADQVERARSCHRMEQDLIFAWNTTHLNIEPTVQETTVQFLCPGPSEECKILESGRKIPGFISCMQALPFVCRYPRDVYLQLKKTQSEPDHAFINRVNSLANSTVIPENIFADDTQDLNITVVADSLHVINKAMAEENGTVGPANLLFVIQFLKKVADAEISDQEKAESLEDMSRHFVEVAGAVLEEQNTDTWAEINPIVRGPMTIVHTVNRVVSNLDQLLTPERNKVAIQHKNIEVEVRQVAVAEESSNDVYTVEHKHNPRADQIEIPFNEVKRLAEQRGPRKVTVINTWYGYGSFQNFIGSANSNTINQDSSVSDGGQKYISTQVGSAIISSTMLIDNEEISTPVYYNLWHKNESPQHHEHLVQPVCVFWNFSISPETGGMWSTLGCTALSSVSDYTSCFCNHTTNFAILLQVYEVQRTLEEESTLKTLTFVGCGVSFCALIVTFILFLAVGVPKSERTTVHKNLIFALAAAEALLMFSELAKTNEVVCITVTAFLHLFFMASFAWMLVEGLLLWSKVVAVNMSEDRRMKFYYVTGWGLPIIIVGVTLATSFNKYVADNHCWLNVQTDIIWAFVGPVLFILTVNTFVLFRVVMVTVSSARRRSKMLTPSYSLEKQIGIQVWATAKPILVLLPVLGLTWLCGVLVHLSIVWAYVFIMLNSFQGLYIFLVYAIYNSEVRNAIQRMKEKKKALSFTNCSHQINYLSSPRNTTSSETGKLSPSPPTSSISTPIQSGSPALKEGIMKGNLSSKNPVSISSIMSTEKPVVELTAFKSSGKLYEKCLDFRKSSWMQVKEACSDVNGAALGLAHPPSQTARDQVSTMTFSKGRRRLGLLH
ncbi:adhesion G-protein coupled receptor D2 isoform X1 [Pleurodeles waltl]|uniref:adhesion G-protein coupled receptor D2 isoform X1 n=1 Tax=Pleurodeles waltl TaxID=8319 RepID=UPI003709892B